MSIAVAPRGKLWSVRRSGADRALRRFADKKDAIMFALTRGETVFIHTETGRIGRMITKSELAAAMKRLADR